MPTLTVTSVAKTKKGRDKIICGKDEYMVGDKCSVPPAGSTIEADTSESSFQGSKGPVSLWWLNSWQPARIDPQAVQPRPLPMNNGTAPIGASPSIPAPTGYTEPERMFVSNIVAAAVTAGHAKDPVDLLAWAGGALNALRHMTDHIVQPEFDKDVGF